VLHDHVELGITQRQFVHHAIDWNERLHEISEYSYLHVHIAISIASNVVEMQLLHRVSLQPIHQRIQGFFGVSIRKFPVRLIHGNDSVVRSIRIDTSNAIEET